MNKTKKNISLIIVAIIAIAGIVIFLSNFLATKYAIGNLIVFTIMILAVPIIVVAISSFAIGFLSKCNWKKSLCCALVLALISFGVGQLNSIIAGNQLDNIDIDDSNITINDDSTNIPSNDASIPDDEHMQKIYDELDRQAYEHMVEQGIIEEGDEITAGDVDGNASNGSSQVTDNGESQSDVANQQDEELYSELYIGIQKSDSSTELIGNVVIFLIAFGACLGGSKIKQRKKAN